MSADIKKYWKAFSASQFFLDNLEIDEFPIDFDELIESKGGTPVLVSTLTEYNEWKKNQHPIGYKPLIIKDAKCFYNKGKAYWIVYNEHRGRKRTRFSLFHEVAHIMLGHLNDERTEIERGGLDDAIYYSMEGAANTFTGNFLAPPILIQERLNGKVFSISEIANTFGLSATSVRDYRMADYNQWLSMRPTPYEKSILSRCCPKIHKTTCTVCGATFSIKGAKYCPICKNKVLKSQGDRIDMKYAGIEVGEHGKATICPNCSNEETQVDGEYCQICGTRLVNCCNSYQDLPFGDGYGPCCDNSHKLPGNARYCPYCGNETTFFKNKFLKPWNATTASDLNDMDFVEVDDTLPF